MARRARILGIAIDEWGDAWDLRRREQGPSGVVFCQGWPSGLPRGPYGCGGPRWIITPEVAALHRSARPREGITTLRAAGAPYSATTIKKQRAVLGISRSSQAAAWWEDRLSDLVDLSIPEFCARHQIDRQSVLNWRKRLGVARQIGEDGWWLAPEVVAVLAGPQPVAWIAEELGVSVRRVWTLRYELRRRGFDVDDRRKRGGPAP